MLAFGGSQTRRLLWLYHNLKKKDESQDFKIPHHWLKNNGYEPALAQWGIVDYAQAPLGCVQARWDSLLCKPTAFRKSPQTEVDPN